MYRELAPEGVPFGLQHGPYTGPPRQLRISQLPVPVIGRLAAALGGTGLPEPILRGTEAGAPGPGRLVGVAAAVVALGASAAWGFGRLPGFAQGVGWLALESGLAALAFAGAALPLLGGRRLPERGSYLLPLDVVEIAGDQLTLTPLGGLRRATIEHEEGGMIALVLRFAHGAEHRFAVASEAEAVEAYAGLEKAQEAMEALSERLDLARALDLDPFFPLRGEGEWATGRPRRSWSLGAALAVGALAGCLVWGVRNNESDHRAYAAATAEPTRQGYLDYLASGRPIHEAEAREALARVDELARIEAWERQQKLARQARSGPDFPLDLALLPDRALDPAMAQARREAQDTGIAKLRGWSSSPEALRLLEQYFELTRARGGHEVSVHFRWAVQDPAPTAGLAEQLMRGQEALAEHLGETLGVFFPDSVLAVAPDRDEARPQAHLDIRYQVAVAPEQALRCTFQARFTVPSVAGAIDLELTVPPPEVPVEGVPEKNFFPIDPSREAAVGTQVLVARCFDRLHEGINGMFFRHEALPMGYAEKR